VRQDLVGQLASFPIARWKAEHLVPMETIMQSNFDALDTSHALMASLINVWLMKLFHRGAHNEWCAKWLRAASLTMTRLHVPLRFNYGITPEITHAAMSIFEQWIAAEEWDLVATSLSSVKRKDVCTEFVDLEKRLAMNDNLEPYFRRNAVSQLTLWNPAIRRECKCSVSINWGVINSIISITS
jgi:hypothetical protein